MARREGQDDNLALVNIHHGADDLADDADDWNKEDCFYQFIASDLWIVEKDWQEA
ncbi:hypothetical protein DACRYDRAFT_105275 [Dacryopinax primogenitus]|uniref:Uncharacterized protein n=1 Tax=Dacryopinax primogenitus (strain DJM 731) TaxID=1858805 RepID=M5G200_DACPD|nr:uncharacterized protein DACRYDRAFT_105275 [Dacryopinax primogenitus]EJU04211.1 hypothetical protein DACRYDRAFT_105275 [Dacryopinax primogenitus]